MPRCVGRSVGRWQATRVVVACWLAFVSGGAAAADVDAAAAGRAISGPDFNGDGYADLAVPIPGETPEHSACELGSQRCGAVQVMYGSASGITGRGDRIWTQDTPGVKDTFEPEDGFGDSFTSGDFDGDGFDDLAASVTNEGVPFNGQEVDTAGAVNVLYGSPSGLTEAGDQIWHQGSPGIPDDPQDNERFGEKVDASDFDGDGYDDLVVVVYERDAGGGIHVIRGSSSGLTAVGTQFLVDPAAESSPDLSTVRRVAGWNLATGDFDHDGHDDLASGSSDQVQGAIEAGAVTIRYGNAVGLSNDRASVWDEATPGIAGTPEFHDSFGFQLAAGDINGDGADDVVVGSLGEDIGDAEHAGAVHILYGGADGISASGSRRWTQGSESRFGWVADPAIGDVPELGDLFGAFLAVDDFDGDGRSEVAISALGEGAPSLDDAYDNGIVHVLRGDARGATARGSQVWSQNSPGISGVSEPSDRFGMGLWSGDFDGDGRSDLAIGSQESIRAKHFCGAVNVIFGSSTGLTSSDNQLLHQDAPGIEGTAEVSDGFGAPSSW